MEVKTGGGVAKSELWHKDAVSNGRPGTLIVERFSPFSPLFVGKLFFVKIIENLREKSVSSG